MVALFTTAYLIGAIGAAALVIIMALLATFGDDISFSSLIRIMILGALWPLVVLWIILFVSYKRIMRWISKN